MPQLELHDFAPQLIWLVITFFILYMVMARVALPRIATVIEERRDRTASDLDQAEQLKQQPEQAIAAYEQSLAAARAKALGLAQETREALAAEVGREKEQAEKLIGEKTAQAEKRIARAKSDALTHIDEVAGEVAQAIVTRLIGAKASKAEVNRAVAKAMAG